MNDTIQLRADLSTLTNTLCNTIDNLQLEVNVLRMEQTEFYKDIKKNIKKDINDMIKDNPEYKMIKLLMQNQTGE